MSSPKDHVRVLGIHRALPQLSSAEFRQKIEALADLTLGVPVLQNNLLKFEMMVPNNQLDAHIQALGLPAPELAIVVSAECQSWDHFAEIINDPTLKKIFSDAISEFGVDAGNSTFAVDVVTKIDKT
ncbi:hypothetical protein B0H11DRAFT_2242992 [Mycena galericulata]|nr:hypothetical protein B0H11DRAFT_2242992 [Mycena galericulata]